jgi:hypothetical protein
MKQGLLARTAVTLVASASLIGVGVQAAHADPFVRYAYGLTKARCVSWGDNGERAGAWIDYDCSRRTPEGYELWVKYR